MEGRASLRPLAAVLAGVRRRPAVGSRFDEMIRVVRQPDFWLRWTAPMGLLVVVGVFGGLAPNFLSRDNINGVLADSAMPIVLATSTTFVIAVAGIDLSLASNVALGGALIGLVVNHGGGVLEICLVGVTAGGMVGVANGAVIGWVRIPDFIVTLGTLGAAEGLALVVSDGKPVMVDNSLFTFLATNSVWLFRWEFILAVAIALVLHALMFWTRSGVHVLATGGNMRAAQAMGIKVARVKLLAYTISGLGAGIVAVLLTAYVGAAQPAADTNSLLLAIAAVVLGGTSLFGGRARISGSLIGAVLLTAMQDGLTFLGVNAYYQPILIGVIVVGSAVAMRTK